ncbi:hypothetical protein ABW21_db0206148 [Orbilia brochopaga]|nr:hypothetical protein ABW21_db0206148 [Drechslerella brochopaga]
MSTSRTMERTLTMLLPTATGIPRELMETAGSLVAQSRQRLSNLNPTEEPAREMAYQDRLKTKLDLPMVDDRPPASVPPKVYKMLFKQFSDALGTTPKTPSKRRVGAALISGSPATPTSASTRATGTSAQPFARRGRLQFPAASKDTAAERKIDKYRPLISELCASVPDAIPHVTAGMTYIFSSARYRNLTERPEVLLCAVYIVAAKELMLRREKDGEKQREWYDGQLTEVTSFLEKRGATADRRDESEIPWREWFDEAVAEIAGEDMRATRWYTNMVGAPKEHGNGEEGDAGGERGSEDEEEMQEVEKSQTGQVQRQVMESGIGSMMQDRVDFLSDKRRKAYAEWKADALRRIAQLEA